MQNGERVSRPEEQQVWWLRGKSKFSELAEGQWIVRVVAMDTEMTAETRGSLGSEPRPASLEGPSWSHRALELGKPWKLLSSAHILFAVEAMRLKEVK